MNSDDFRDSGFDERADVPLLPDDFSAGTQAINLTSIFCRDVTSSGSFDMRGVQKTTLARLLNAVPIPALLLKPSCSILFTNEACAKFIAQQEQLSLRPFADLFHRPADAEKIRVHLKRLSLDRKPQIAEAVIGTDSIRMWGRIHFRFLRMGEERFILVLVEDLSPEKKQVFLARKYSDFLLRARDKLEMRVRERTTELTKANEDLRREIAVRRTAEGSLGLAAKVIESSNEAILVTNHRGNIVQVNDAFCETTGYAKEEVLGKKPKIMTSGRHNKEFWNDFRRTLTHDGFWKGEVWDRRKSGEIFPKLLSVSAVRDADGHVTHYVAIFSDITRIKQTEAQLQQLAHYDPLTELPNRLLFRDRLNRALIRAEWDGKLVALMFLDLDEFKNVNDTVGHPAGDELLVQVAGRLKACVRKGDTVARMGGDEFTVVMPSIEGTRPARLAAHRIMDALSSPFAVGAHEIFASASIGISMYPTDGDDIDRLLQRSDSAMYHAKAQGKKDFQFFSQEMNDELIRLVEMETVLRKAMGSKALLVYYQPLICCRTNQIIGAEALLRLKHPNGDIVSGGPFIPVAEERGLIAHIGEWVLHTACEHNKRLLESGFRDVSVSVNVSMRQLKQRGFVRNIFRILDEAHYDPSLLELELTESTMMSDLDSAVRALEDLRHHGIRVIVDDFGTGYSSLSYLRRLPVDKVKIDKSFVEEIAQGRAQRALVQSIISVAHSLDLGVVAEGIESVDQLRCLCELGCDAWQGYYFAPAMPLHSFESLLRDNRAMANKPTEG